jgi:flavin-binding protein dodecin
MVEKTIELTGLSSTSIEEAVALAVARAAVTISGILRGTGVRHRGRRR